jgi:hypothetical protein
MSAPSAPRCANGSRVERMSFFSRGSHLLPSNTTHEPTCPKVPKKEESGFGVWLLVPPVVPGASGLGTRHAARRRGTRGRHAVAERRATATFRYAATKNER